jgi:hypothetical protein
VKALESDSKQCAYFLFKGGEQEYEENAGK